MVLSTLFTILISLLIIYMGHYLWEYLKDNYSVKKTNHIIGSQIEKYKEIIKELQESKQEPPIESFDTLKSDLEDFLNEIK